MAWSLFQLLRRIREGLIWLKCCNVSECTGDFFMSIYDAFCHTLHAT